MPERERIVGRVRLGWAALLLAGVMATGSSAGAANGLGGLAPPPSTSAGAIYDGLTVDEVEAIVKGASYNYARVSHPEGDTIQITDKDGYRYELTLADCPQSGERRCQTLNVFSFDFNEDPKVTLKSINDFNNNAWGVRAMLYDTGKSGIALNLGVDGGISGKWLIARLGNFDIWVAKYGDFVAGKTPPPAPGATP